MLALKETPEFTRWFHRLRDIQAQARIQTRMDRLSDGNAGDCKALGEGILEIRIDYGPGYRVYFTRRGSELVILLAGGDKGSQARDIQTASRLARIK